MTRPLEEKNKNNAFSDLGGSDGLGGDGATQAAAAEWGGAAGGATGRRALQRHQPASGRLYRGVRAVFSDETRGIHAA
jgi:DhnA family fructose-bisphosphate aldolase class Ia